MVNAILAIKMDQIWKRFLTSNVVQYFPLWPKNRLRGGWIESVYSGMGHYTFWPSDIKP